MNIHQRPSPNHGARPDGMRPTLIVLHSDASPSLDATFSWICARESRVSYHYSIGRTGNVYQHVPDERRAWHAGRSEWHGRDDGRRSVNGFSIGVNLGNRQDGVEPYPDAQLEAAAELVALLCARHCIPALQICTHTECATPPGRKHDPAPGGPFDLMDFLKRVQRHAALAA